MIEHVALDALDEKAAAEFPGLVVRKDLVRRLRSAYGVPMFVVEFLLGKYCASTDPTAVVIGEMSVKGLLQKVTSLPERLDLALGAGARKTLIPSENKRDLAEVPDEVLNKLQPIFYTNPINAAIRSMGLE